MKCVIPGANIKGNPNELIKKQTIYHVGDNISTSVAVCCVVQYSLREAAARTPARVLWP